MKKVLCCLMFFLCLNAYTIVSATEGQTTVTHVVIVWLKPEVTAEQKDNIMQACLKLKDITAVKTLNIGAAIASEREIVDDSFSFALTMTFASRQAMQEYLADKVHIDFVNQYIKPNLKKIVVYDF